MKEKGNWGPGRYNAIFESYAVSHAVTHLQPLVGTNFSFAPFGRLQSVRWSKKRTNKTVTAETVLVYTNDVESL